LYGRPRRISGALDAALRQTNPCRPSCLRFSGRPPSTDSGYAALVRADELSHARDALLDRGFRGGVGEADVLAFAGHARAEVDVGEHRDPGLVQEALPELLRIRNAHHAAGLGHVGPGVEGAARRLAGDARGLVQQAYDQVAPHEERVAHLLRIVLRTVDRLDRRPLAD